MSNEQLADTLRPFYPSARQRPKKGTPPEALSEHYQKQPLINIRSALNRHLQLPPYDRTWDLVKDPIFKPANRVFSGNLITQKELGLDTSSSHRPISEIHLKQIFDNYFIPHFDNDLTCLQHNVCFDISFYLGKCGIEGLCEMRKYSFALKINAEGHEYLQLTHNETTKKSQDDDRGEINERSIILNQPNSRQCPIRSFKLYLSKLTELNDLFQQPNPNFKKTNAWDKKSPCRINTIGNYLASISQASVLSYTHTNHYVRGTTATGLKKATCTLQEIGFVLKNKNLESLKCYLDKPTMEDGENFSTDLFKYTGHDDNSNIDNFDVPPLLHKKK